MTPNASSSLLQKTAVTEGSLARAVPAARPVGTLRRWCRRAEFLQGLAPAKLARVRSAVWTWDRDVMNGGVTEGQQVAGDLACSLPVINEDVRYLHLKVAAVHDGSDGDPSEPGAKPVRVVADVIQDDHADDRLREEDVERRGGPLRISGFQHGDGNDVTGPPRPVVDTHEHAGLAEG